MMGEADPEPYGRCCGVYQVLTTGRGEGGNVVKWGNGEGGFPVRGGNGEGGRGEGCEMGKWRGGRGGGGEGGCSLFV